MSDGTSNKYKITEENEDHTVDEETAECDISFDDLLSSAGKLGRYQWILLLSTLPFYMYGVFVYYSQMFITETSQNHWCWIPELENLTEAERIDLAIPKDDSMFGHSRCTAYVADWTEVLESGARPNNTWNTEPCQNGWEFDKTEIPYPTIASEQGWVCDKDYYQATAQSFFSVGSILGCFSVGWVADRYGRIPAAIVSNLLGFVGGVSSSFATNFVQFTIFRFIMGMAYNNCMIMVYLIVLEYVAPKCRSFMANLSFAMFYSIFVTTLPFLALGLGHWKYISLVTSVPLVFAVFAPLIVPESPRWLLSKGRIEETINKVHLIAKTNKKVVPQKLIDEFRLTMSREKVEDNVSLIEVFKTPVLRKVFMMVCLEFACCNIIFDGLIRSVGYLDSDFFISFAIVSVTEFPSLILVAFVMDYFGRRWLGMAVMAVCAIFSILIAFVGTGAASVAFAATARFAANMAYVIGLQWIAEVLPTSVRGSGLSFANVCGFAATAITPYIVYSNTYIYWLPMVILALTAVLGAVIAFLLPETANKEIPHTFDDAVQLAVTQDLWEMPCVRKKPKETLEQVNPNLDM